MIINKMRNSNIKIFKTNKLMKIFRNRSKIGSRKKMKDIKRKLARFNKLKIIQCISNNHNLSIKITTNKI